MRRGQATTCVTQNRLEKRPDRQEDATGKTAPHVSTPRCGAELYWTLPGSDIATILRGFLCSQNHPFMPD